MLGLPYQGVHLFIVMINTNKERRASDSVPATLLSFADNARSYEGYAIAKDT
jgi:hypothetical protein